jgi:hypothetical protein
VNVSDHTVADSLDTLLDGRTTDRWLTIVEIMDELTCAWNDNPIRLRTRGLCGDTYLRWCDYVDRNRVRGFTYRHVAVALTSRGYRKQEQNRNGQVVLAWGPRR